MTEINYTYEVTRVDPDAKAMEILYTSPEHGTMLVGARMPWEGETVEMIAQMYSPMRYWVERTLAVAPVETGVVGQLSADLTGGASGPLVATKLALVRAMRDTDYGDGVLWDAFKEQLALADDASQEDWQMAAVIEQNDPMFVAVLTTIYGDDAPAQIAALFGASA
jgi:hypothetical protein